MHSEETRRIWSEQRSGKNNPMYGVRRYGPDNPNYGKKHPGLNRGVPKPSVKGVNNCNWNGGIGIRPDGYVWTRRPEHHFVNPNGCVLYHRIVYESFNKCSLIPWADVHHIDENPMNNFPNNLKAMTRAAHMRIRHTKRSISARNKMVNGRFTRDSNTGRFISNVM